MPYKVPFHLNENYSFEVLVKDKNENFAGKLTISHQECTLRVMGERVFSDSFSCLEVIECHSFREYFLLTDISFKSRRSTSLKLNDSGEQGGFYEIEFKVGFVVKAVYRINEYTLFNGFNFDSNIIKKWTGITNKQSNLLLQHSNLNMDTRNSDLNLFNISIENIGEIYLSYYLNIHSSLESISSGVKLTPKLGLFFDKPKGVQEVYKEIKKMYALIAYFWGRDFPIKHVFLSIPNVRGDSISVFYNTQGIYDLMDYPLIPLGFDTRDKYEDYQGVPLDFFCDYYNLSNGQIEFFTKYLRYKRLKSNEEKFLGYFRILEKLVHDTGTYVNSELLINLLKDSKDYFIEKLESNNKDIKKLIGRIIYANRSKYNTTTCISRFLELIPEELRSIMKYGENDIQKICDLRNDMTHANEYEVSEQELYSYTNFVHQLLVFALFNKLLKVPLNILIPVKTRFTKI